MNVTFSVSHLQFGISVAIHLQCAIVETGTSIIDNRLVKTLKNFRLVVLKENSAAASTLAFFHNPLSLTKLALFMVDALRESGRSQLPFVIAVPKVPVPDALDTYLVVGICGSGDYRKRFCRCTSTANTLSFLFIVLLARLSGKLPM